MLPVWATLRYLLFASAAVAADFSPPVVSVLDGDTLEVLHIQHPERIRLTQSQRHQKNGATRSIVRMGRRTFCACHHLSYGQNKIAPPSSTNTPTKKPKAMTISIIPSRVDGEFHYGLFKLKLPRSQGMGLLRAGCENVLRPMAHNVPGPTAR